MWQVFLTVIMVSLLSASSASGESGLNGEWEKINEWDGIIGYSRWTSKTSVNEIKAEGLVDAPVAVIEAVLRDAAAKKEYSDRCIEASKVEIPGLKNTTDTYYVYHKVDLPWPVYDRDAVARLEFKIDNATGILFSKAHIISTCFRSEDEGVVRVSMGEAKWILTPVGRNKTKMLYQILAEPGGYLPAFLINLLSKNLAINTISGIRQIVKKDKYKNAKSITTSTPWNR